MQVPVQGPVKAVRYDRQLRLWGEDGQAKLEAAKILVLGANATNAETLKNLVLPGIGSFTLVDGKKVEAMDLGNNFFVTHNSVGESRAKVVTDLLKELNEFVNGHYVEEDPAHLIDNNPNFVKDFSLVITSTLPEAQLIKLAHICWENNIPLLISRAYGLIGYLRIITPEHRIVEAKEDNPIEDLRLANPFPELLEFAKSINFSSIIDEHFGHVPFPVIMLQKT